ncbi:hypothetical protein [Fodinibius halophilus]|uniref:Uncharacterized protein n=1 Tax=Fodinibius halophilus TaxID=1736908 RepID=A0A6M1T463_9BACT|nr:hypothetical protein [Fodinibius halophilus]NGP90186.1 hypothetical protein [Fodinibius halophilus]
MGRAMVIIVFGLLIAMGYTFSSMHEQRSQMTQTSVTVANTASAKNLSLTGLQFGISKYNEDKNWSENSTENKQINNGTVEYSWKQGANPNSIIITSIATINGVTDTVVANVDPNPNAFPSPAAMAFYGKDSKLNGSGSFTIRGKDRKMDGTSPIGYGEDKPGIISSKEQNKTIDLVGGATTTGDPAGYVKDQNLNNNKFKDKVDKYLNIAQSYSGTGNMGTQANPQITKIEGSVTATGKKGAGVLIIPEGATFNANGSFEFKGQIIVRGTLEMTGSEVIYGSMIFSDNSNVQVKGQGKITGSPTIYYSSDAIDMVNDMDLGVNKATINSIYN